MERGKRQHNIQCCVIEGAVTPDHDVFDADLGVLDQSVGDGVVGSHQRRTVAASTSGGGL